MEKEKKLNLWKKPNNVGVIAVCHNTSKINSFCCLWENDLNQGKNALYYKPRFYNFWRQQLQNSFSQCCRIMHLWGLGGCKVPARMFWVAA